MLPIFRNPCHSYCKNHHVGICCMYHQLGKSLMERLGSMKRVAVRLLLHECKTSRRGQVGEHHMWIVLECFDRNLRLLWIKCVHKGSTTIDDLDINIWCRFRFRYQLFQTFHQVRFVCMVHDAIYANDGCQSWFSCLKSEDVIHITVSSVARYIHPWEEMNIIMQVGDFRSGLRRFLFRTRI